MTPEQIALWVKEIKPNNIGLVTESLFGFQVQPGAEPIDQLIAVIDTQYLDWDPNNPKFKQIVVKILGKWPTDQEWVKLIESSSQQDALKDKLKTSFPNAGQSGLVGHDSAIDEFIEHVSMKTDTLGYAPHHPPPTGNWDIFVARDVVDQQFGHYTKEFGIQDKLPKGILVWSMPKPDPQYERSKLFDQQEITDIVSKGPSYIDRVLDYFDL